MMTPEQRIEFYLGEDLANNETVSQIYFPDKGPCSLNSKFYVEDTNRYYVYNYGEIVNNESGVVPVYVTPLRKIITSLGFKGKNVMILAGDVHQTCDELDGVRAFTKVRRVGPGNSTTCILKHMNHVRHWEINYKNYLDLQPFSKKLSSAVWRGATTGHGVFNIDGTYFNVRTGNRFDLILNNCNKWEDVDVGFSKICQVDPEKFHIKFTNTLKTYMTQAQMSKHKYIISVEGNDKDSGINWKLRSNSVVLMAKPTITSWLMESMLKPDVHYVQLADDFSDLREKIDWCNDNQDKCEEIISNAHEFMSQFQLEEQEKHIEESVIHNYLERVLY